MKQKIHLSKVVALFLALVMVSSFTACGEQDLPSESVESVESEQSLPPSSKVEEESSESEVSEEVPVETVRPLIVEKTLYYYAEWPEDDGPTLVRSCHETVTLGESDAAQYPVLAEQLGQIAVMQENTMLDEFDNLASIAKENYAADPNGFETMVSTLDIEVRRADTVAVSLLSDTYSHYGQIQNFRSFYGSNYDTETGEPLLLSDVFKLVNNDLALAVEKELTEHTWTGDFYSETAVQDFFANAPYDISNWTLDYNGVTFYFAPGDLSDDGMMVATVAFADYPELFHEKYMAVPDAYTVELPLDISFFTQLDSDAALDAFSISCQFDETVSRYLDYGVYTDVDGQYYYDACYISDLHPYYLKTENGHYIYFLCEDIEEGMRSMSLMVLKLNEDGSVDKVDDVARSPEWKSYNRYITPNDPHRLMLDAGIFSVGADGLPIS